MSTTNPWIRLEDEPEPFKFRFNYTDDPDLDELATLICQKGCLPTNVTPGKVEFLGNYSSKYDRGKYETEDEESESEEENGDKPLRRDLLLEDLEATATSPLVVRYPLSNTPVVIRCNLSTTWFRQSFPHNTGLWYLLREASERKFKENVKLADTEYFFVYTEPGATPGNRQEEQIENAYQLNTLIERNKKREMSLSIRVEGRKAYADWEIAEVLKVFLDKDGTTYQDITSFKIADLPDPNPALDQQDFKKFIDELKTRKSSLVRVNRNEATCREFISSFMTRAVAHVKKQEPQLQLKVEEWLNGSRGYGFLDYCVVVNETVVLVHEAKREDFEKGAAQNIVQMHSAVESLGKRRLSTEDDDKGTVPVLVYGIVTNALQWVFLRWGGSSDTPTIEVSYSNFCSLDDDIDEQVENQAGQIIGYLISILQSQAHGLKDPERRQRIKRRRYS